MPDKDDFYRAIGHAIVAWSDVGYALSMLYEQCLQDRTGAARDSFCTLKTFSAKMDAVNAAAKVALGAGPNAQWRSSWTSLSKRLRKASNARNELAHNQLRRSIHYVATKGEGEVAAAVEQPLYLVAPHLPVYPTDKETRKFFSQAISLEYVERLVTEFESLGSSVRTMSQDMDRGRVPSTYLKPPK